MQSNLLVIRSDGGQIQTKLGSRDIASGHLMRMLSIAEAWRRQVGNVLLVTHEGCRGVQSIFARYRELGCDVTLTRGNFCETEDDAAQLTQIAARKGASAIYLDGYHFDSLYQKQISDAGFPLVMQDDTGNQGPYHADLLVSSHFSADQICYGERHKARLLLGPRYALLSSKYLSLCHSRITPTIATRLLITLGSSDPFQDTERALQGFINLPDEKHFVEFLADLQITIVVGATNPREKQISLLSQELQRQRGTHMRLAHDVRNMADLQAEADFAFTAPGGTVLELLAVGVPSAIQIIHETHQPIAWKLNQLGLCQMIGDSRNLTPSQSAEMAAKIARGLVSLAQDQKTRRQFSERGQNLVDCHGAERVVEEIRQMLQRH